MALLFGCTITEVAARVPRWEIPYWEHIYAVSPWDYGGLDDLFSKTALQVCRSNSALKPGVGIKSFKFLDPFEDGTLSDQEFLRLSEEEKDRYIQRSRLTHVQFNALTDEQKKINGKFLVQNLKNMML